MIREMTEADRPAVWAILEPIIRAGESFAVPIDADVEGGFAYWNGPGASIFVMEREGQIVGSYCLRANQKGGGSHVANAGYAVAEGFAGQGIARKLCEHSLEVAKERGFQAMQFNFVISTNVRAVRLWQRCGFEIVGRLPKAFLHPSAGYVDVFVMYQTLA